MLPFTDAFTTLAQASGSLEPHLSGSIWVANVVWEGGLSTEIESSNDIANKLNGLEQHVPKPDMATWNHVVGGCWVEAEVAIAQYGKKGMMWADEYVNFCFSDLSIKKVC